MRYKMGILAHLPKPQPFSNRNPLFNHTLTIKLQEPSPVFTLRGQWPFPKFPVQEPSPVLTQSQTFPKISGASTRNQPHTVPGAHTQRSMTLPKISGSRPMASAHTTTDLSQNFRCSQTFPKVTVDTLPGGTLAPHTTHTFHNHSQRSSMGEFKSPITNQNSVFNTCKGASVIQYNSFNMQLIHQKT